MTEQAYQTKILKKLEAGGWYVLKLEKTNKNGIPDLLALKRGQRPLFIEVKAKGGRPSKLQLFRLEELSDRGFDAHLTYPDDEFLDLVENFYTRNSSSPKKGGDNLLNLPKPF